MKQINSPLLHITIGTHPAKELNLEQEIKLTKAALLYADRVKLYSVTSSALGMASRFGNLPLDSKLKVLERITPLITAQAESEKLAGLFGNLRKLLNKNHLSRDELIIKNQFIKMLNSQWEKIEEVMNKIVQDSHINEFDVALEKGVLDLHTFQNTDTNDAAANFMAECIEAAVGASVGNKRKATPQDNHIISEFVKEVFSSVSNSSTYPLFDEQIASLVRAGIRENKIPVHEFGIDRGRQTGLVKHLFENLPAFEDATVSEILDVRSELDIPLTRFRKAIINFSQEIKSAAWDKDFSADAEKVYYRDVQPALLDVEESIKSNKFVTTLLRKFADKPAALPAGSLFSMAISRFSSLPDEIALSLGIGVASASIIYEAYDEWINKKKAAEQNLLYFYYQTNKRLGG